MLFARGDIVGLIYTVWCDTDRVMVELPAHCLTGAGCCVAITDTFIQD